jgi:hypothetical protein
MSQEQTAPCDDEAQETDPLSGPFCRVDDLAELGFGERTGLYRAVERGDIPSIRIGRNLLIPTSWARKAMGQAS